MDLEFKWVERKGRDREGDLFQRWYLVHVSERILAVINGPLADEVSFNCSMCGDWEEPDTDFVSLYAAKKFSLNRARWLLHMQHRNRAERRHKRRLFSEDSGW
jgi:hypothetical protein